MYKNQKIYFTKPIIPDDVIVKSNIKIKKPKPKKQPTKPVKKIKTSIKTIKSIKQQNIDKLLKTYGKNNNMISLLIYLLKNKDAGKSTKPYKTKTTFKSGYKRSNSYETKSQITKNRIQDEKIIKQKNVRDDVIKLNKEANTAKLAGNSSKEEKLLKEANDLVNQYLTKEDYETYGKFLTPEQKKSKSFLEGMKKNTERKIFEADEIRKKNLKKAQVAGRKKQDDEKELEYNDYLGPILFTEKFKTDDFNKLYDDFVKQSKGRNYSKRAFVIKAKKQYKNEYKDAIKLSVEEKNELKRKTMIEDEILDFWKSQIFEEMPTTKKSIKDIKKDYKFKFGQDLKLTSDEIKAKLTIIPLPPVPPPIPETPVTTPPASPTTTKKGRVTQAEKLDKAVSNLGEDFGSDVAGIKKTIKSLEKMVLTEERTRLKKLQAKDFKTEEEQAEIDSIESNLYEIKEQTDLLREKKDVLVDFIEQGYDLASFPEADDINQTVDDYEGELFTLIRETDSDSE